MSKKIFRKVDKNIMFYRMKKSELINLTKGGKYAGKREKKRTPKKYQPGRKN